jgi:hypothetical protein
MRNAWGHSVRLTDLSFEQWIEHAFSHEVHHQCNPWFFDPNPDRWDAKPVQAVDYLTRLFEEPDRYLEWFTDAQIPQGLIYLVSTSTSGEMGGSTLRRRPQPTGCTALRRLRLCLRSCLPLAARRPSPI